jgi:pyridoxal phosphate enzyme (YggS family)
MQIIQENLTKIKVAIAAAENKYGRPPGSIVLVAVSKAQSLEKIKVALALGQIHFGESYLQEALPKIKELTNPNIVWHYIGRIQSKKAKLIAQNFSWVDSVASYEIAELLNKYRPDDLPELNVCIQVNISNEANKGGILPEEILPLAKKIAQLPKLKLRGLMAIPAYQKEFDLQLKPFNALFLEFKNLQDYGFDVDTLNMGMSDDFEAAIAAGATVIRIGTAIFGSRPISA